MTESIEERPNAYSLLWRARDVLLAKPAWLDYVRQVYTIDPGGHPFLSYIGVNFTKDTIKNYKFYFSFFKRLSPGEIDTLLPVPSRGRFDALYPEWHPSHEYKAMHRGTTFALKVDPDGTLTHYYHLRLRGLPFGLPERMAMPARDHDNYHGACEEFTGSKIHLKRYFYFRDPETIAESLRIGGLPDDPRPVDMLEYIESDGRDKFAWISSSHDLIRELLEERGQPRLSPGLFKMCHDCRFELFGPGSARDGSDHSIYFVQHGPVGFSGYWLFDGVRSFIQRHLKLPRFPEP